MEGKRNRLLVTFSPHEHKNITTHALQMQIVLKFLVDLPDYLIFAQDDRDEKCTRMPEARAELLYYEKCTRMSQARAEQLYYEKCTRMSEARAELLYFFVAYHRQRTFSSPEAAVLLVCARNRDLS